MSLSRLGQATVRAAALIDIGRCADALPLLHQAIAQDPDDLNARCLLGLALMREGRWQEAETAARDAIAVAPAHGRAHSLRAYALKALNRRDEALQEAQRGVELDPPPRTAIKPSSRWRWTGAPTWRRRPRRHSYGWLPSSAEAHFRAGTVSMFREEYPEAEAFMRRALSLDPTYRGAHNNLGVTLIRQGRRAEAFAAYQRAAALDPSDQTAAKNIRAMARHNKFPLPKWARRPILWGPGVVVALVLKVRNRHEMDSLPKTARREVSRWTRREVAGVAILTLVGTASLYGPAVSESAWSLLVCVHLRRRRGVVPRQLCATPGHHPSRLRGVSAAALIDATGTGFTPAQTIDYLQR